MTCIVGMVEDNAVWMAADSCGSDGHRYAIREKSKLFEIGHDRHRLLVGVTGSFLMADYLRFRADIAPRNERSQDLDRWIRTTFVDAVRAAADAAGELKNENGIKEIAGWILVGTEGRLFEVHQNLQVLEAQYWGSAIGSGMDVAHGSLWTTRSVRDDAHARLVLALEAAEAVIATVRGPFEVKQLRGATS